MGYNDANNRGIVMLDHTGIAVSNWDQSKLFYEAAFKPLGIVVVMEVTPEQSGAGAHLGFGKNDKPVFWVGTGQHVSGPTHFAFTADSRAAVDEFYSAALAAGGRDNGAPGIREYYHPNYYGAFVLDPDGNNVEAVCHKPG
jgi:catechol 2,3-dioxygenase-like lactoylglutathione lyase family enzyme